MAAELKQAFGVTATLTEGGRGVFDVLKDGTLIYSKTETGRFPNVGEIAQLIKS